jgi:phytanoyl-CoA hydroxylase
LPTFETPPGGRLSEAMVGAYREAGVIILRDFVSRENCAQLQRRALELVDAFDPCEVRSVFSTTRNEQLDDTYFIESGDKIRFFLENDAFDDDGRLRQ